VLDSLGVPMSPGSENARTSKRSFSLGLISTERITPKTVPLLCSVLCTDKLWNVILRNLRGSVHRLAINEDRRMGESKKSAKHKYER
jgi:hypothetical protein